MYFPFLYSEKYQKTITFMQQANLYIIYTAETTKLLFKSTLATLHEPPLYLKRDRRYPHLALPVGMWPAITLKAASFGRLNENKSFLNTPRIKNLN